MIQIEAPWSVILLELTALMTGVSMLLGVLAFRRRRREWAAAQRLVEGVKAEREARRQRLRTLLASKYGYQGEPLDAKVAAIDRAEWRFYQNLVNVYLKRDAEAVAALPRALAEVIEPYHQLEALAAPAVAPARSAPPREPAPAPPVATAPATASDLDGISALDDFAELQHLREENTRLAEELQITMGTISRMLSEYSSIVGRSDAKASGDDFMDMFNEESS